jgi:uncharacterized protein YndB with AHSA1/START domain
MLTYKLPIKSSPNTIWDALTRHGQMKQWMGEPEMDLEISTSWEEGTPFILRGFHHIRFENTGTVLKYKPFTLLSYNYLSSISRLPEIPENYCVLTFELTPLGNQTELSLTVTTFPTETIHKHLAFYWRAAVQLLKNFVEQQTLSPA